MSRLTTAAFLAVTLALAAPVRAQQPPPPYSIAPQAAYDLAAGDPNVYILDVRTAEEWKWVGHPGRNGTGEGVELESPRRKVFQVSWKIASKGGMITNPSFVADVDEIFGRDPDVLLILMCRSGVRGGPARAALLDAGYHPDQVLNMIPGFEGRTNDALCPPGVSCPPDAYTKYRDFEGWKFEDLPYTTSGKGYGD